MSGTATVRMMILLGVYLTSPSKGNSAEVAINQSIETVGSDVISVTRYSLLSCEVDKNHKCEPPPVVLIEGLPGYVVCNLVSHVVDEGGDRSWKYDADNEVNNPIDGKPAFRSGTVELRAYGHWEQGLGAVIKLGDVGLTLVSAGTTQAKRKKLGCAY